MLETGAGKSAKGCHRIKFMDNLIVDIIQSIWQIWLTRERERDRDV